MQNATTTTAHLSQFPPNTPNTKHQTPTTNNTNNTNQPTTKTTHKKAEAKIVAAGHNKEYLPIEGLPAFRDATAKLLLGAGHPALAEGRVATLQALSGTGSLRVAAAFIAAWLPGAKVWCCVFLCVCLFSTMFWGSACVWCTHTTSPKTHNVPNVRQPLLSHPLFSPKKNPIQKQVLISNPTWGNHRNIFSDAGVEWQYYRYFDADSVGLDFSGMTADLEAAPEGSVVLLHGACVLWFFFVCVCLCVFSLACV
jgi:aspartate aminotransferase